MGLRMSNVNSAVADGKSEISRWVPLLLTMLSKISYGSISIATPTGDYWNFRGQKEGAHASLKISNWKFFEELFLKGDIGLGEAYIAGYWESDNINDLIKFAIDNKSQFERVIKGSLIKILFYRLKHLMNRNSEKGSKKNIHAHYDLGNDFYQLWLDKSMTYSSALFDRPGLDLRSAQERKYQNILDQLNLKEGDHILEVGCGWGGFLEYAAQKGVRVTGITISKEQYEYTKNRIGNFENLARVELMDYRNIKGEYDHIVSIEMFEALGKEYWSTYFTILHSALKKNGKLIIQTITINDQDFGSYQKGTDFIQQYIFPGGMLPSPGVFKKIAQERGFNIFGSLEFGLDYGHTLKLWEESFSKSLDNVKSMGFDENFIRTWKFYLKYCQGGFEAKKISVFQFYLTK